MISIAFSVSNKHVSHAEIQQLSLSHILNTIFFKITITRQYTLNIKVTGAYIQATSTNVATLSDFVKQLALHFNPFTNL